MNDREKDSIRHLFDRECPNVPQMWQLLIKYVFTNITDIWFWFSVPLPNHHLCLALPSIMSSIVKQCWSMVCVSLLTLCFILELIKALKLNFPALLVGWRSEGGKQSLLVQPAEVVQVERYLQGVQNGQGVVSEEIGIITPYRKQAGAKTFTCFQITSTLNFFIIQIWYLIIKVHSAEKSDNWSIEFCVLWHSGCKEKVDFFRTTCFQTTFTLYHIYLNVLVMKLLCRVYMQVEKIRLLIDKVGSVEDFKGQQREVIIISTVSGIVILGHHFI